MTKIALVTDSTASMPQDLVNKYEIIVAPQILIWGKENFEDGVNITPSEFYTRLKKTTIMPTTTQVTVAKFHEIYQSLLAQDYQILTVVISSKLSGTLNSALQAREMQPANAPIEIIDSNSTAMALGFQLLTVARAIKQGASFAECVALAEKAKDHTGIFFAVDTLEFLHRGGRIGGATRFLGTMLNFKPILELRDGRVEPIERVRTRGKSLSRIVELTIEQIGNRTPVRLSTLHANAPEDAKLVLQEAAARLNPIETVFSEVSPVVGVHAGPGVVGIVYMAGM
jgi:DegV family protein with EDD domain